VEEQWLLLYIHMAAVKEVHEKALQPRMALHQGKRLD
jgi:hypothetical protein